MNEWLLFLHIAYQITKGCYIRQMVVVKPSSDLLECRYFHSGTRHYYKTISHKLQQLFFEIFLKVISGLQVVCICFSEGYCISSFIFSMLSLVACDICSSGRPRDSRFRAISIPFCSMPRSMPRSIPRSSASATATPVK